MIKHETTISFIFIFIFIYEMRTHRTSPNCKVCCGKVLAEKTVVESVSDLRIPGDVASSDGTPEQGGEIPADGVEDQLN